jgi:hypothetical protein
MPDRPVEIQSVIDVDVWNKAQWNGMIYLTDPSGQYPPILGFAFHNAEAGKQIFEKWKSTFGDHDENELIRIAIIEGDLPGWFSGYTVTIGLNTVNYLNAKREFEQKPADGYLVTMTRTHRMSSPNSPHLIGFKNALKQFGVFGICPVHLPGQDVTKAKPFTDLSLGKREILFRQARDVDKDMGTDPDSLIYRLPPKK